MVSAEYEALAARLVEAGAPATWSKSVKGAILEGAGPVAAFVNTSVSARPYVDILLAALPRLAGAEQEMVVRALSERGMPKAGAAFAALMRDHRESASEVTLWALGNALATIQDPATFDEVVTLCNDRRLGMGRQMLFTLLPRIGTDAAYQAALTGIEDDSVRGHALEALGRFGNPDALERIKQLVTTKGLYETKAKATAIRRLERAAARRG